MTDYFTADLHLGHELVAEIRGFDSVEEHDKEVMYHLGKVLGEGSNRVWVLGDISSGRKGAEEAALDQLRLALWGTESELHLVSGNHDSVNPMHRHSEKFYDEYREVFTSIDSIGTIRHRKAKVMLSHYPYSSDHTDIERYPEFRLRDLGKPLVHGHTHSEFPVSYSDKGTLQIHVGLDAWGLKPVKREYVTALIDELTL